jgi:DNA helicase-2/ATP-dependent DNA helicase PcrA
MPLRKKLINVAHVWIKRAPTQSQQCRCEKAVTLWSNESKPSFLHVLRCIAQTRLFEIPESLSPIAFRDGLEQATAEQSVATPPPEEDDPDATLGPWDKILLTPFAQIEPYAAYVTGQAAFDTHQGVKGLEFPKSFGRYGRC